MLISLVCDDKNLRQKDKPQGRPARTVIDMHETLK